jgi:hypothetical protein
MDKDGKQSSIAVKSAMIAAGVSLGVLAGAVFRECVHFDRGECSPTNPTLWLTWVASFFGVWAVVATMTWFLERDRQKRQQ